MPNKIPLALWIFQGISFFFLVAHGMGFYLYLLEFLTVFSFVNFLGTVLNIINLILILFTCIGIWKRNKFGRIGSLIYAFLYFIGLLYGCYQSLELLTKEDIFFQVGLGLFYLLFSGSFLLLFLVLLKSKIVQNYFTSDIKN